MSRRKLSFRGSPFDGNDVTSPETGYKAYVTYRRTSTGEFDADLTVVRIADARIIFRFEGAPRIGPWPSGEAARDAAVALGDRLIAADILNPAQ